MEGQSTLGDANYPLVAASGVWTSEDTFEITVVSRQTPFTATLAFHYAGETLVYQSRWNVSFGPTELSPLTGRRML